MLAQDDAPGLAALIEPAARCLDVRQLENFRGGILDMGRQQLLQRSRAYRDLNMASGVTA